MLNYIAKHESDINFPLTSCYFTSYNTKVKSLCGYKELPYLVISPSFRRQQSHGKTLTAHTNLHDKPVL